MNKADYRRGLMEWHRRMVEISNEMSLEERAGLQAWERENLDGCTVGTSDWPGWRVLGLLGRFEVRPIPYRRLHVPHRRPKARIPEALRWQVWERDDFTCRGCGARQFLRIDHVVPEVDDGETTPGNLQTLCRQCNSVKGKRPIPFQLKLPRVLYPRNEPESC